MNRVSIRNYDYAGRKFDLAGEPRDVSQRRDRFHDFDRRQAPACLRHKQMIADPDGFVTCLLSLLRSPRNLLSPAVDLRQMNSDFRSARLPGKMLKKIVSNFRFRV